MTSGTWLVTESNSKSVWLQIDRDLGKQRKRVEHGILCGEVGPAMSLAEGSIREGETPVVISVLACCDKWVEESCMLNSVNI